MVLSGGENWLFYTRAVSLIGAGTALRGVWNGVHVSHRGVPTSVAIWKAASSRNFPSARTA